MIVKEMSRPECLAVVSSGRLGRLACAQNGRPYVIPIHYALDGNCLYSFSMPGQKIDWMRENPHVCVEVEDFSGKQGWKSVVISGKYQEFPDTSQWHHERIHAWALLEKHMNWWEPGALKPGPQEIATSPRHIFYGIDIEDMTGRMATDSGD